MPSAASPPVLRRRRRIKITPLRILLTGLTLVLLIGGGLFYVARHWTPSRAGYPTQGITVSAASGAIIWPMLRGEGVDFVYLDATSGADGRDPAFSDNLAGAHGAGLRYGAVHRYSLCASATDQATRFIATVPRDPDMLPPVVQLGFAPDCTARPSRDKLLAELNIFLNQIEIHAGKPALLRISRPFEARYEISSGINRTLWLTGALLPPDYATRPWVLWTASPWKRIAGIDGPIEWDVVRP